MKPDLEDRVVTKQNQQKLQHDRHAKQRVIQIGDAVYAKNWRPGPMWIPATVIARTGPVSYQVELQNSKTVWRRHLDQLRLRSNVKTVTSDEALPELSDSLINVDPPCDGSSSVSSSSVTTPAAQQMTAPRRNPPRDRRPPDRLTL